MIQTILGSGGSIGVPLARELKNYTNKIRLVSRNPQKVNEDDELIASDISDPGNIEKAISGSEIVYVTVGFEYKLKVWRNTWPPFIKTVIESCKRNNARLVFFDNVYLYDRNEIPHMTESSQVNPPSKKGEVRQQIFEMIMKEVKNGSLLALIARAADFYGPGNNNSILTIMVYNNLIKGKKAQAFGDIEKIHTFTYTPDAAKATAILGNTPDAFNQVWHVPTTSEKLTTRHWIEMIGNELNKNVKIQTMPSFMIKLLGAFVPVLREFPEMLYQYEQDYIFNSSKFTQRFGISATPPSAGVKSFVESMKK